MLTSVILDYWDKRSYRMFGSKLLLVIRLLTIFVLRLDGEKM